MQVLTPVPMQRFSAPPQPRFQNQYRFQRPNLATVAGDKPIGTPYINNATHFRPAYNQRDAARGMEAVDFDGKRMRKSVVRKTVDYNPTVAKQIVNRIWQRDYRDQRVLQPDGSYYIEMVPPIYQSHNPINAVTTKFVRTSTNKMRCPIFCVAWTPEGRRLVTGASSGEFTLWNGLTFNFETILQAHDASVRSMVWSHSDTWMVTGDHMGYIKYWQSNMNNVRMFQAHKDPVRGIRWACLPLGTQNLLVLILLLFLLSMTCLYGNKCYLLKANSLHKQRR